MPNPVLQPGDVAPAFTLKDDAGREVTLADYLGSRVVLYFYPRDNTPGCTTEAVDFQERFDAIAKTGAKVIGVSPDGIESHARFKEKHDLGFALLADTEREVAERYGVWRTKKMYGKEVNGIVRSTFIIDPEGKIEHVFDNVRAKGHAQRILDTLEKDGNA